MKKKILFFVLCLFILPMMFLFSGCNVDKDIEIRISGDYIQWSYQGENIWHDVIDIASIKSALGETYKGDTGEQGQQGIKGDKGVDGKQVEFRRSDDYIQWHYVGEETWQNLISIEELKNDNSQDENLQQLAFYPLDDGTYGVGVGNATELSNITIPDTYLGKKVTKIVDKGFANCKNLKKITLSNNLESVGFGIFSGCDNLEYNAFDNGLYLGNNDNEYLLLAKLKKNVSSININKNTKIIVTMPTTQESQNIFSYYNIDSIMVENENTKFDSRNNCNAVIETLTNTLILGCKNTNIPVTVKTIGKSAFARCNISNLTITEGIVDIMDYAFYNCQCIINNLTLPNSLINIGNYAFSECTTEGNLILPNNLLSIGERAFFTTSNIYFDYIFIPRNVNKIGYFAFGAYNSGYNLEFTYLYSEISVCPNTWDENFSICCAIFWYSETQPTTSGNYWHYVDGVPAKWD